VPPVSRLRLLSPRWNGSNTRSNSSGAIPGPESSTTIRTTPSAGGDSRTVADPPYFTAFVTTFVSARFNDSDRALTVRCAGPS